MTKLIALIAVVLSPALAKADWSMPGSVHCDFAIMAMPIASLDFAVEAELKIRPPIRVIFGGIKKELSTEEVATESADEWRRFYFSKEDPPNSLILVLLKTEISETERKAILINPNFTIGDRIPGTCKFVSGL